MGYIPVIKVVESPKVKLLQKYRVVSNFEYNNTCFYLGTVVFIGLDSNSESTNIYDSNNNILTFVYTKDLPIMLQYLFKIT